MAASGFGRGSSALPGSSSATLSTSIPLRCASAHQGTRLLGCSWSVMITASPGAQSIPFATTLIPTPAASFSMISSASAPSAAATAARASSIWLPEK